MSEDNGKKADAKEVLLKHILDKYTKHHAAAFQEALTTSLKDAHQNISKSFFKMFVFQQYQLTVCIRTIELLTALLKHKGVIEEGEFEKLCKTLSEVESPDENEDGEDHSENPANERQDGSGDSGSSVPTELREKGVSPGSGPGET